MLAGMEGPNVHPFRAVQAVRSVERLSTPPHPNADKGSSRRTIAGRATPAQGLPSSTGCSRRPAFEATPGGPSSVTCSATARHEVSFTLYSDQVA